MQLEKLSQELEKQYQAYRLQEANEQTARQTYEQDKKTILAQSETKKDEYRTALDTLCNYLAATTEVGLAEQVRGGHYAGIKRSWPQASPYNSGLLAQMSHRQDSALTNEVIAQLKYVIGNLEELQAQASKSIKGLETERDKTIRTCRSEQGKTLGRIQAMLFSEDLKKRKEAAVAEQRTASVIGPFSATEIPFGYYEWSLDPQNHIRSILPKAETQVVCNVGISLTQGKVASVEYAPNKERDLLGGLRRLMLNISLNTGERSRKLYVIDCGRYNDDILGPLKPMAGKKNSPIRIAWNQADEAAILNDVAEACIDPNKKALLVVHNCEKCSARGTLQQIALRAGGNNVLLFVTNVKTDDRINRQGFVYQIPNALHIHCAENKFYIERNQQELSFLWYPDIKHLPDCITQMLNKPKKDNAYPNWIGTGDQWVNTLPSKGNRRLDNIPIGLNMDQDEQEVVSISLEDEKFASFIVGASRSGKSTLLQTIIHSVIRTHHPDDVEIWLVDFAMTEFSAYIKQCPPHVRYVIIDNSAQLICDFIDRLVEVMEKRSVIFMRNGWGKLSDVPPDRYMPAILVVVDEFAEMSNILVEMDGYRNQLEKLLRMGAKYGFHFVFSSQTFTTGTRGLTDTAKAQIQLRLAMKCMESSEVREALTVRGLSDHDGRLIDRLQPHYVLIKDNTQRQRQGNQLTYAHVLYFRDDDNKARYNRYALASKKMAKSSRFSSTNNDCYIYKQPDFFDGTRFVAYSEREQGAVIAIKKAIAALDYTPAPLEVMLGDPVRLRNYYLVPLSGGVGQNVLVCAPSEYQTAFLSILMTMQKTMALQGVRSIEVWCMEDSRMRNSLKGRAGFTVYVGADAVSERVAQWNRKYKEGNQPSVILLLEPNRVMEELKYQGKSTSSTSTSNKSSGSIQLPKGLSKMLKQGNVVAKEDAKNAQPENKVVPAAPPDAESQDCVKAIQEMMLAGPRHGLHFIAAFDDLYWFQSSGMVSAYFRHYILFHGDYISSFLPTRVSRAAAALSELTFLYSNGLDTMTLRPLLHNGVQLKSVREVSDDEYLL